LGLGSFGTVWKARDTELDRTVAIKIPRKGQLPREEVEQFFREARTVAQLRHPNIVPVHEVGRDRDTIFIVSDLIRGVSLGDWLSGAKPSPREAAGLIATIADAIHHAHQQGVIHRDLKPSNILLDDAGQPHVMDFGLAKRETGEITMTVDGHVLGTPAYMSPEQAAGHGHWTDRRTDVYSLGVILFRMLTGELPFRGNHQMQIHQRLTADAPDLRKLNRHIPRDLCTICLKCLERDSNRRYATAKELADELRRFIRHEPILSRPVSRVERILRWAKRKPALATAAALTLFLAVAGPITALVIAGLYNRQGQLLSEKDNLIKQHTVNKQDDAAEIAKLRSELDLWEARANPWQFWPPTPTKQPRKMVMQHLAEQQSRLSTVRQQASNPEQRVQCCLAVAIMNDVLDRHDEAVRNYREAHQLLVDLTNKPPAELRYSIALADCCAQLARLLEPENRQAAADLVEQRTTLLHRLAAEREDLLLVAEAFESEFDTAFFRGFEKSPGNLRRAERLLSVFDREFAGDPAALYRLVCLLGGREPILITRVKVEEKAE
jgi:serine/threonine protein kinase